MSLRGSHVVAGEVVGDVVVQAAAAGLAGVAALGEAAIQAARASGRCDRRQSRGRPLLDVPGNVITPSQAAGHLSIVSNPSSTSGMQLGNLGNNIETEQWKTEKEKMQHIIQQQSEDANKLMIKMDDMQKKMDKPTSENPDLKKDMDMEIVKIVDSVEHGYQNTMTNKMEKLTEDMNARQNEDQHRRGCRGS